MGEIRIIEKPDDVPFSAIQDVMLRAHASNFEKGIVMKSTTISAEEMEQRIGERGKCYVAMDGDQIVGTSSFSFEEINKWFATGEAAKKMFTGVLPEHKGRDISSLLHQRIEEDIRAAGCTRICFDTAYGNKLMRKIAAGRGFYHVNFFAPKTSHYSVEMMKWLDGCPFPRAYVWLRYQLKKLFIVVRFKPGRIKRFGV